ncbi:MAG: hypothetical protein PHC88_00705 [Terrimicrobiaceae bacterium]|nr:hypothetical protein [Terrimicrobiaceae bacterium]
MNGQKRVISGQESWTFSTKDVEAAVTRQGGHLAPVRFRIGGRWVEPFDIAPWAEEKVAPGTHQVLRVMRGDFFCMPFGGNETPSHGEQHPPHGETANARWRLESGSAQHLHLSLRTSIREGRVDKRIRLIPGHTALYLQHVISGMTGPMCLGHHAILKIPEGAAGRVSLSPFRFGQVFPGQLEESAKGGYSILKPGAKFKTLSRVPQTDGKWADLSVYPAREGYEDLVLMASETTLPFAWTALTVPEENHVWFALKDPRVLPSTVFWISNGGRHYAPWNGRHRRAIGLEEVVANFHYGLAESARANPLTRAGTPTCVRLDPQRPFAVNYIMAMAEIPRGFDIVKTIHSSADGKSVRLASKSGKSVSVAVDTSFLSTQ